MMTRCTHRWYELSTDSRTIYRQLTSSTVDPPRFGNHWDDIGFQGEPFCYLQQLNF